MPDGPTGTNPTPPAAPAAPVSDTQSPDSVAPDPVPNAIPTPTIASPDSAPAQPKDSAPDPEIPAEVAHKIGESHNVLIALSSDPSVDEMAAAIGLSLYLDKLGKRATAIYSGATPNALEFLKPEETFEPTVDTLQDFVIALNKDKADHLRYKLDGDYVKIYITPYRTRISEEDLEFSYGDFNVDLVLALDVTNGIDLDSALREHGRIMHDASIVNITTGNPGKFGEIEWSDKTASSVSEMIAKLLYSINSKTKIEKEEATAFLTGIVAATNRFSNAKTTPSTMRVSSRLMESGANQQLISKNITPDIDNEMFSFKDPTSKLASEKKDSDPTKLDIGHGREENVDESKEVDDNIAEKESTLLDDLKAAEASLAQAGAETTPDLGNRPVKIEDVSGETSASSATSSPASAPSAETSAPASPAENPAPTPDPADIPVPTPTPIASTPSLDPTLPPVVTTPEPLTSATPSSLPTTPDTPSSNSGFLPTPEPSSEPTAEPAAPAESPEIAKPEKVIAPPADFDASLSDTSADRYGKMLEDALAGLSNPSAAPAAPESSFGSPVGTPTFTPNPTSPVSPFAGNPAAASAPAVATTPEINGVPEINYMPMPGEEVLPPPPAPPIDINSPITSEPTSSPAPFTAPIEPAAPVIPPTPSSLGPQPAMQDQVYTPQASDPSAFKIPGM